MKNCRQCGSMIDENDVYCPRCGIKNIDADSENNAAQENAAVEENTDKNVINLSKPESGSDTAGTSDNVQQNTQQNQTSYTESVYTENLYSSVQPDKPKDFDVMCLVGFILTFVLSFVGLNIISLIICIIGVINFDETKKQGKGFGIAGIIINSVLMVLTLIMVIVIIACIAAGGMAVLDEFFNY